MATDSAKSQTHPLPMVFIIYFLAYAAGIEIVGTYLGKVQPKEPTLKSKLDT
jgi:hypothetical protein